MKNAIHSCVHILKRHMAFRKADESLVCSDKTFSFFKPAILLSKNVQLLSLLSINKNIVFL
jgi:hypothetical protein